MIMMNPCLVSLLVVLLLTLIRVYIIGVSKNGSSKEHDLPLESVWIKIVPTVHTIVLFRRLIIQHEYG